MNTESVSSGLIRATLANALHLPRRRVDYPHRVVSEGGEVARGKRGKGGADNSPRDAAVSLIAVANSYLGDEVLTGVRAFLGIPAVHYADTEWIDGKVDPEPANVDATTWQLKGFDLPHLQSLKPGHTFADALTALIEAARDGAFDKALSSVAAGKKFSHGIEVRFAGPQPFAAIEIDMWVEGRRYKEEAQYFLVDRPTTAAQECAFAVSVQVDHQAIYALGRLFRGSAAQ